MATQRIPFNRPIRSSSERAYIDTVLESGRLAGDGVFCKKTEAILREMTGTPEVLVTSSCTHALEMCAMLLDAPPGAEVIVPDFTFPSTANAFATQGLRPIFADIDPGTLNISPDATRALINEKTVAIVVMHYGGIACDMEAFHNICQENDLRLLEDNAHGLGGAWEEAPLGTLGCLAAQSFHETKNFSCGEGGALFVNDRSYFERAAVLRDKGTDRSLFFRGDVDRYTWVDVGSSYVLGEISAALLLAQLEEHEEIQANRRRAWNIYLDGLTEWAAEFGVSLPLVPEYARPAYHAFALVLPTPDDQKQMIEHLDHFGIAAVFHYQPLHESRMGRRLGVNGNGCPVSSRVSKRLVRLPLFSDIRPSEAERVVEATIRFRPSTD